jgi:hypothetical protein
VRYNDEACGVDVGMNLIKANPKSGGCLLGGEAGQDVIDVAEIEP